MESKLGPALTKRLATASPDERLEVQIFLRREPLAAWAATADSIKELNRTTIVSRAMAAAAQRITRFLDPIAPPPGTVETSAEKSFPFKELCRNWINNSVSAEISADLLRRVLGNPEVEHVELVPHASIEDLLHGPSEPLPAPGLTEPLIEPGIADQVQLVKAPALWDQGFRGGGVLVAVIDTGIEFGHPDLSNRKWAGGQRFPYHGFNFESPGQPTADQQMHGTQSAGLIAGDGSSGQLATGIAPEATLMALRIGERECQAWSAFEFAVEHGADVISMSMGWRADLNPNYVGWRRACEFLLKAGIVLVCSAGNTGLDLDDGLPIPRNVGAPAICPPPWLHPEQHPGGLASAIACGETDLQDNPVTASSHGPGAWEADPFTDYPFKNGGQGLLKPDLCGPGRDSMTCNPAFRIPGQPLHIPHSGTSAATATVAGCAALLVQAAKKKGQVFPQRIQQALEERAVPIAGQTTKQNNLGSGRVDVAAAYQFGVDQHWW